MGSVPQHPFFLRVIELLQQYDRDWPLPYITVMYSTGPLFLSVIWKEYIQDPPSETNRIRVLMQDEYKKHPWSFFTHHTGNSWHGNDAQLIFWVNISRVPCQIKAYKHRWANTGCSSLSVASSSFSPSAVASSVPMVESYDEAISIDTAIPRSPLFQSATCMMYHHVRSSGLEYVQV
jgi:hypothetical protein